MASILSIIQDVATVIGVDVPTVFMTSQEREHVELAALANEMAERIGRAYDWQALAAIATYTGDGVTEDFDLPSDFDRMPVSAKVWSTSIQSPLSAIPDRDTWLAYDVQNISLVFGAWTIYGGQIHIKTALGAGATAKHWYQSNQIVKAKDESDVITYSDAFAADADMYRLDDQLLKLGIIWQWKANKGLAYGEDLQNYEELKEKLIARDKGGRMMIIGQARMPGNVDLALPVTVTP
ncbi:MAG: hypothetical protein J0H31_25795 [Alphaproteobacteria bacterium]|nr:hypothetical protein [Alphaproteobacteria bacterium]